MVRPLVRWMRRLLFSAFHAVRGGGAPTLSHKKEYHQRRRQSERQVLKEAQTDSTLFRRNVCPACGERDDAAERFANPVGFAFARCPGDGTVFMDPVPSDATLARLYNDASYSFHWIQGRQTEDVEVQPTGRTEYGHIKTCFQFPPNRKPKLLDVGCATGGFLLTASNDFDAEGVELNADMAAIARRRGLRVTTGRLEEAFSDENRFDVITMLQVIEHVIEPVALLREAARLLRPGGIIYLNTPNVDSASFSLFRERHMHVSSFGHVSLLTKRSMLLICERSGLSLLAHDYCGSFDISLHDLVSRRLSSRFRHRMALYRPRLFHTCNLVEQLSVGLVGRVLFPRGHPSYQWAALQKPRT